MSWANKFLNSSRKVLRAAGGSSGGSERFDAFTVTMEETHPMNTHIVKP